MKTLTLMVLSLLFIGCEYNEVSSCNDAIMTEVKEGDLLRNGEENTRIKIIHKEHEKMICVLQGSAYIFRK